MESIELQFGKKQYCIQEQQSTEAPTPVYTMGCNKVGFEGLGELELLCKPVILETAKGKQNLPAADYSSMSSLAKTVAQRSSISKHDALNCNRTA